MAIFTQELDFDQWISLIGDVAIPLSVFVVGALLARALEHLKRELQRKSFLIEKRWELYQDISEDLNKVFQFCTYVGGWKEWSPQEIIEAKRRLDSIVFASIPLLGCRFIDSYVAFSKACFDQKRGAGLHLQIRANEDRFKNEIEAWTEEWSKFFVPSDDLRLKGASYREDRVQPAYAELLAAISETISGAEAIGGEAALKALRN